MKFSHRLSEDVNRIYDGSVLLNFVGSGMMLPVYGFFLMFSDDIIEISRYGVTFCGMTVQIYLICIQGDQLQLSVG